MSWVKLDDQFFTHPKAIAAGREGRALYLAGLCWTKAHLTDGMIPKTVLAVLATQADTKGKPAAERLVTVRLWHDEGDHWRINDFHDHQESADDEKKRKAEKAERMREYRRRKEEERRANERASEPPPDDYDAGYDEDHDDSYTDDACQSRSAPRAGNVPQPDTDTDTDTSLDIETPTTTSLVAPEAAGGGGSEPSSLNRRRRRTTVVGRAVENQLRSTDARNPVALRQIVTERLQALFDRWPDEIITDLDDDDLVRALTDESPQPSARRRPPPVPAGLCVFCAGSGVYRWGEHDWQQQQCPNGCQPAEGASA